MAHKVTGIAQKGSLKILRCTNRNALKPVSRQIHTFIHLLPALTEDPQCVRLRAEYPAVNKTLSLPSPGFQLVEKVNNYTCYYNKM